MIKYLGILIDNKLTFREHTKEKSKKATTVLNMIKRNLYFAPKLVKSKAFTACVLPIMEYGSTCWTPTNKKLQNQLERVNNNAAKFVTNTYPKKGHYDQFSMTKIMNNLNWNSIEQRRQQARLTMAYKILNNHVILDAELLPKFTSQRPLRNCNSVKVGVQNQLREQETRLDITANTFFYATPKLWNKYVTPAQANAPSIDAFRGHFKKQSNNA